MSLSIVNSSDDDELHLKLLGFWTLSVVWYCKNTTFQELDLLPFSGGKVPTHLSPYVR